MSLELIENRVEPVVMRGAKLMQAKLSVRIKQMECPYRRKLGIFPSMIFNLLCSFQLHMIAQHRVGDERAERKKLLCQHYCAFVAPQLDRDIFVRDLSFQQLYELDKQLNGIDHFIASESFLTPPRMKTEAAIKVAEELMAHLRSVGWWELSDDQQDRVIEREIVLALTDGILGSFELIPNCLMYAGDEQIQPDSEYGVDDSAIPASDPEMETVLTNRVALIEQN